MPSIASFAVIELSPRADKLTFDPRYLPLGGFTMGYNPNRQGFFLSPADENSNNSRIYIVSKAVKSVNWL